MPALSAQLLAFLAVRHNQSSHSSSSRRGHPTILLSMPFRATSSSRNSSARGVQDSVHHSTHFETVESKSLSRRLMEPFLFNSSRFMPQNILHPEAMRFRISCLVASSKCNNVPKNLNPSPAGSNSTLKPSSMNTSSRLC